MNNFEKAVDISMNGWINSLPSEGELEKLFADGNSEIRYTNIIKKINEEVDSY